MSRVRVRYNVGADKYDVEVEGETAEEVVTLVGDLGVPGLKPIREVRTEINFDERKPQVWKMEAEFRRKEDLQDVLAYMKTLSEKDRGDSARNPWMSDKIWEKETETVDYANIGRHPPEPEKDYTNFRCGVEMNGTRCDLDLGHKGSCQFVEKVSSPENVDSKLFGPLSTTHEAQEGREKFIGLPGGAVRKVNEEPTTDTAPEIDPARDLPTFADHPEMYGGDILMEPEQTLTSKKNKQPNGYDAAYSDVVAEDKKSE